MRSNSSSRGGVPMSIGARGSATCWNIGLTADDWTSEASGPSLQPLQGVFISLPEQSGRYSSDFVLLRPLQISARGPGAGWDLRVGYLLQRVDHAGPASKLTAASIVSAQIGTLFKAAFRLISLSRTARSTEPALTR